MVSIIIVSGACILSPKRLTEKPPQLVSQTPKIDSHKTVLLRERKRHTARHVASTPSAVLSWGTPLPPPHPDLAGGTPSLVGGTPSWGTPGKGLGTSHWGTPPPERTWDQWRYYGMDMGYSPRKDMGPVEVLWDGDGVTPTPLPRLDRQMPVKTR